MVKIPLSTRRSSVISWFDHFMQPHVYIYIWMNSPNSQLSFPSCANQQAFWRMTIEMLDREAWHQPCIMIARDVAIQIQPSIRAQTVEADTTWSYPDSTDMSCWTIKIINEYDNLDKTRVIGAYFWNRRLKYIPAINQHIQATRVTNPSAQVRSLMPATCSSSPWCGGTVVTKLETWEVVAKPVR